jgi:hypothetical protein
MTRTPCQSMGGGDRKARQDRKRVASSVAVSGSISRNTRDTIGTRGELTTATIDNRGTAPLFRVPVGADESRVTATWEDFGRNNSC